MQLLADLRPIQGSSSSRSLDVQAAANLLGLLGAQHPHCREKLASLLEARFSIEYIEKVASQCHASSHHPGAASSPEDVDLLTYVCWVASLLAFEPASNAALFDLAPSLMAVISNNIKAWAVEAAEPSAGAFAAALTALSRLAAYGSPACLGLLLKQPGIVGDLVGILHADLPARVWWIRLCAAATLWAVLDRADAKADELSRVATGLLAGPGPSSLIAIHMGVTQSLPRALYEASAFR